ncbi:MAG: hypothetical protein IT431_00125 [Phycisphaerales bacterium]|nr:hypothetical protein [Phycisphaerales bacterium]
MLHHRLSLGTRALIGAAAGVLAAAAAAQTGAPEMPGTVPAVAQGTQPRVHLQPGVYVDPKTGIVMEVHAPVEPIFIPRGGLLAHGTLPDPQREAGRPMRPGGDPWIPDGTGYWPPAVEDQAGDLTLAEPLMMDWSGPGYNGLTPPDPDLARGREHVITVTNDDFAVYDTAGNELFYSDINDFLNEPGVFLYDCKVIFDPWSLRWVMMYHRKDDSPQESQLYIIVSADEDPMGVGGWWYYRFPMLQDGGTGDASWADYFDLGYSNSQLYASGNMFRYAGGFRWARHRVFNKAEVYAGGGATSLSFSNLTNADGTQTNTPRAAKLQSGTGDDAIFINSRWGGGSRITLWKLNDAFGTNTLTRTDIEVGNYTPPPDAVQPNGSLLDTIDNRLMTAVVTNDTLGANGVELFTGMTVEYEGQAACLLYKFDPNADTLKWERVFWGADRDYWFPSSAADYSGSNFWVFTRCSQAAGEYASARYVEMISGTFSNSSTPIEVGTGNYSGFRWGDYFGGQLDWGDYWEHLSVPGRPSKVWLYGEYATNGGWDTHVGATSAFPQGDLSNVVPTTTFVTTGNQGGPFSPSYRDYTLQSVAGDTAVAYEVTSLPSWLTASKTYGQLWGDAVVRLSVNSSANSLAPGTYTDNVYFTDTFNGGSSFTRVVQLVVEADCYADYNGDGNVNTLDVLAFLNDWANGNSKADCNGDRVINTLDVLCFLNAWAAGC